MLANYKTQPFPGKIYGVYLKEIFHVGHLPKFQVYKAIIWKQWKQEIAVLKQAIRP